MKFSSKPSNFSQGISVQANAGVAVEQPLSTKESASSLSCGTGTLSVAKGASVTTNDQLLKISTDSVNLEGTEATGALSTGDALVVMSCSTAGRGVGLGSKDPEAGELLISGAEMQRMHSGGLILGGNCGSMVVAGVKEKHSNNVKGVVRLLATSLHEKIIEEETAKYYPQNVIIERPEDATIASVNVEEGSAPTSLEFVNETAPVEIQADTASLHVETAAVARTDTVQAPLYATADQPI